MRDTRRRTRHHQTTRSRSDRRHSVSTTAPLDVSDLQRSAGNRATTALLQRHVVQRAPADPRAVPPQRPTPRGKRATTKKKEMSFVETYLAISGFEYDAIGIASFAAFDRSELRTLHSLIERKIEEAQGIAKQQAADPAFEPPDLPNHAYVGVVSDLRAMLVIIAAKRPYATINAIVAQSKLEGSKPGASDTANRLWTMSEAKVRELLWREELGSVGPMKGYDDAFDDDEVVKYGYIDRIQADSSLGDPEAWGKLVPLFEGEKYTTDQVVSVIRAKRRLVPLEIAKFLMLNADTDTGDDLLTKAAKCINAIDQRIRSSLQLIHSGQIGSLPWKTRETPEGAYLTWLKGQGSPEGSVGAIFRTYVKGKRSWTDIDFGLGLVD